MSVNNSNEDCMISLQSVSKHYGKTQAVQNISFAVHRGEVCGFLGPNGAGKTTTLRMLLGLVRPTTGRIEIQGVDVQKNTVAALDGVGAIIEESRFYPYLTGEQNLRQALRLRGLSVSSGALLARLEQVGLQLAAQKRVKGYSLGMRQRLALALAMLQDPSILILDEPMNGLDPAAMRDFRIHLMNLAQSGVTILLSSHILSEVEQVATRLVFVNHGQVVGIEDRTQATQFAALVRVQNPPRLKRWLEEDQRQWEPSDSDNETFIITLENPEDIAGLIRRWVQEGVDILEVRPYTRSLERQYLQHMGDRKEMVQ